MAVGSNNLAMSDNVLLPATGDWNNHYRPKTLEDMALTSRRRAIFSGWIKGQLPPNLMLSGSYGIGKTTIARIIAERCSNMGNDEWSVRNYCFSFSGTRNAAGINKIIDLVTSPCVFNVDGSYRPIYVLDEFEKLPKGEQSHFLSLLEDNTDVAGFILNVNEVDNVIEAIQDRCFKLDFVFRAEDKPEYVSELVRIGKKILENEGVLYEEHSLLEIANQYWCKPRTFINSLQGCSVAGVLSI